MATMPMAPLVYQEIKGKLRARLGRQWPAGARLPAVTELARELGAGHRNTLRAVQELVAEGYLTSRRRRGTFVARQVEPVAGATESGVENSGALHGRLAGRTIAMIGPRLNRDKHFDEMTCAAQALLLSLGAALRETPYRTGDMNIAQANDLRRFAGEADAILLINPGENHPLRVDARQALAVITAYGMLEVLGSDRYDIVASDEWQGARLAAQRLRSAGCRRPCVVGAHDATGRRMFDNPSSARFLGFQQAWGEPIPEIHQLPTPRYGEDSGARALREFSRLDPMPDGVFCTADELAVGFVMGALALGLEAGRDYHIVGFDGQERGQTFAAGPLTTVKVPASAMGRRAAELLARRLVDCNDPPQRIYLGCELIEGSTAPLKSGDGT